MRTNIVIDDELMAEAQRLTGLSTKRKTVEFALRQVVSLKRQEAVRAQRGKLNWEGDLNQSRQAR